MADTPTNPTKETGFTGLIQHNGIIQQDFLRELQGKKGYKKFDEMRLNSPVAAGLLNAITLAIRTIDWDFISDEGEDDPRLDFIKDSLDGMSYSFNDHISETMTMLPFGFSLFEVVYKRDGGRMLWRKFAFRGQDTVYRWMIAEDGGIEGIEQQTTNSYNPIKIPIEKLLLYRTTVERNNPEGRSILRVAYVPYYYAKHIQEIEAVGIERDLAGLPTIQLPPDADVSGESGSDYTKASKLVRRVRNDEQAGLVLPDGWDFKLVASEGSRLFDTSAIISRYNKQILMSGLAQFLMLGMDNVGSLALSEDQTTFFSRAVNAYADIVAETFTKFAIPPLYKLNGIDSSGIRLEHSPAGDIDVEKFVKALQMADGMLVWTAQDEVQLRSILGLPAMTVDQIEENREQEAQAEQQRLAQITAKFKQGQNNDDMSAETFAAENAPDDKKRKRSESAYRRKVKSFFEGQAKRIKKAVK